MTAPPDGDRAPRTAALQEKLRARGLDGALLVHGTDVLYLAGTRQNAALWVPARGAPLLLVRRSLARAREESALADVRPFPPSRELRALLGEPRRVGFTFDVAPVSLYRIYERALAPAELEDVSAALRAQRSVKGPPEIACIRRAGDLLCAAFRQVPTFLRPGMQEVEVAAELDVRLRRAGSEGVPRVRGFNQELGPGVVTAGASATAAGCFDGAVTGRGLSVASPTGASRARIERDAPVVLDYTAVADGYVADMTRMAVCGRLSPALERAYAVALAVQDEVARALRPGAVPSALWARACARAEAAGLGERFMGPPGAQARFVGHGVGLELDEWPVLAPGFDEPLVEGQTLALEPKFVFPEEGAVGIENTWAVTPRGGERLTELEDAVLVVR